MKLGTVAYKDGIYNLDYMDTEDLKELIKKVKIVEYKDIKLLAILNRIYSYKSTMETINKKVNNQLNSMKISIDKINPKFVLKSKNYEKIEELMNESLHNYEQNLKKFCSAYDFKINELILDKVEMESNFILQKDEDANLELKKEIKKLSRKIKTLDEQKINKAYEAMETEGKAISTQIKRPHNIKNIKKFFINKFNTYNVIVKNIIVPLNERIDDFRDNKLKKLKINPKEFDLKNFEEEIEKKQKALL